jgi:CheY-like chemotaxis protein
LNDEGLSAFAHELKTPIAVIAGYAELFATRNDEATRTRAAEQIVAASRRLSSTIDALLGLQRAASDAVDLPATSPLGEVPTRNRRRVRVLLVDDDVFIRRLLRLTLPADEFELADASDGHIALRLIDAQRPALVVLDWRLPTLSGSEVLPRLKDLYPRLPVVVLTVADEEREHARTLGADAFLAKPFSPRRLLQTIDALVVAAEPVVGENGSLGSRR